MQDLFKIGVFLLFFQTMAFGLTYLFGFGEFAFMSASLVTFFLGLVFIFSKGTSKEKYIPADLALGYAFGVMALDGLLSPNGTVLLIFGTVLSLLRCVIVGNAVALKQYTPEPFRHGFLGALPLGIGVVYSFAIMWHRAGKPKQS